MALSGSLSKGLTGAISRRTYGRGWFYSDGYYVRADGTASTKDAATGPASDATKCMSLTTFNGLTKLPGETYIFSDQGGDYTVAGGAPVLDIDFSGEAGRPVTLQAAPNESPTFAPVATNTAGINFQSGVNYLTLDGLDVQMPAAGASSTPGYYLNATMGTSGDGHTITINNPTVTGTAGVADDGDAFNFGGGCQATINNPVVIDVRLAGDDDLSSSPQAFTTHGTENIVINNPTVTRCNCFVAMGGTSNTMTINGGTLATAYDTGFSVNDSSGTAALYVNNATITLDNAGDGFIMAANSAATMKFTGCTMTFADVVWSGSSNIRGLCWLYGCTITNNGTGFFYANGTTTGTQYSEIRAERCTITINKTNNNGLFNYNNGGKVRVLASRIDFTNCTSSGRMMVSSEATDGVSEFVEIVGNEIIGADGQSPETAGLTGINVVRGGYVCDNTIYRTGQGASSANRFLEAYTLADSLIVANNIFYQMGGAFDPVYDPASPEAATYTANCSFGNSNDDSGTSGTTNDPNFVNAPTDLTPQDSTVLAGAVDWWTAVSRAAPVCYDGGNFTTKAAGDAMGARP